MNKKLRICNYCKRIYDNSISRSKKYCGSKCYHKDTIPWNKGLPRSDDVKQKISIKNTKKILNENQLNYILNNYKEFTNKELSERFDCSRDHIKHLLKINKKSREAEVRKKLIRKVMCGRKLPMREETKQKLRKVRLGTKHKPETIEKIRKFSNLPENIKKFKIRRRKMVTPKKNSSIEIKIQDFLKQLNIEFFTHQYMKIKHGYQCDILIPSMNLVIECDGNYWHKYPIGNPNDILRTQELLDIGFKVLRFWETEIQAITLPEFKNKLDKINLA